MKPTQNNHTGDASRTVAPAATASDSPILDALLNATTLGTDAPPRAEQPTAPMHGVIVGKLVAFDAAGLPLVEFAASPGDASSRGVAARSTVTCGADDVDRDVVLMFDQGDTGKPIVMGFLQSPQPQPVTVEGLHAEADGERLELTAEREIVLRCGAASITLTRAGKVIIRGTYVLSRSTGANRIKGGSIQLN